MTRMHRRRFALKGILCQKAYAGRFHRHLCSQSHVWVSDGFRELMLACCLPLHILAMAPEKADCDDDDKTHESYEQREHDYGEG